MALAISIRNVLLVRACWCNLFSVSKITSSGHIVAFDKLTCDIHLQSRDTLIGLLADQLYEIHLLQPLQYSRRAEL